LRKSTGNVIKNAKRTKGFSLTPVGAALSVVTKGSSNTKVARSINKASAKVEKAKKSVTTRAKKAGKAVKKEAKAAGKVVKKAGKAGFKLTPLGFLMGAGDKKRKAIVLVGGIAALYLTFKVVPKVISVTPQGRAISAMR